MLLKRFVILQNLFDVLKIKPKRMQKLEGFEHLEKQQVHLRDIQEYISLW